MSRIGICALTSKWHRSHSVGTTPMQKHLNIQDKKIVALLEAAERYNRREVMNENEEDAENFTFVGSDSGDATDAELY